jgi:hypothetical protein
MTQTRYVLGRCPGRISTRKPNPMRQKAFAHRYTEDDLIESICMTCFLTAGHSKDEQEMLQNEAAHVCRPEPLPMASHFEDA